MPEILRSDVRLDHITLLRLEVVSGVSCVHGMTYQVKTVRSYVKNISYRFTGLSLFFFGRGGRGGGVDSRPTTQNIPRLRKEQYYDRFRNFSEKIYTSHL